MPFYNTSQDLQAAYTPLIGKANYMSQALRFDAQEALRLADLQPGECVFDAGCLGGAHITVPAKQAVGHGTVVTMDAMKAILDHDLRHCLTSHSLHVAPAGTLSTQVHVIHGDLAMDNLDTFVANKVGQAIQFNCIFLVHVWQDISPSKRQRLITNLRRMLSPQGRIIMNVSARFAAADPTSGPDAARPFQFRVNGYTEAPGCVLVSSLDFVHS